MLHDRVEGLSDSFDSAVSSWIYFKKQIALYDLHTYAGTVLSYKPLFVPCVNVSPDVLFITCGESDEELGLYANVGRSMLALTKNIHRTSVWKSRVISDIRDLDNVLAILASEILILQPKAIFIFYSAIVPHLNLKVHITAPMFIVERLTGSMRHKLEINERLKELAVYLMQER